MQRLRGGRGGGAQELRGGLVQGANTGKGAGRQQGSEGTTTQTIVDAVFLQLGFDVADVELGGGIQVQDLLEGGLGSDRFPHVHHICNGLLHEVQHALGPHQPVLEGLAVVLVQRVFFSSGA